MSYIGNTPFTAAFLTDTFSGDGSTTGFTLSAAPANTSSIIVAVTGVLQDPSTYSVSGTTLTFSAAPPSGTDNISVRFLGIPASGVTTTAYRTVTEFTATAGQTTFSVPSYTVGYVDVYRNGVMLGTADFTASSGTTIVLASGATSGDLIRVESFYVSSVLNAIPATSNAVITNYINDDAVTTAKIDDGAVTQAKLASGVAGNGPAFSAYKDVAQTIATSTTTKATFIVESYDTNSCYDASTSTFTPNVAGYYQIIFTGQSDYSSSGRCQTWLYKNGSAYFFKEENLNGPGSTYPSRLLSALVYANGTTDYFEIYIRQESGSNKQLYGAGTNNTVFQGYLVRAA